MSGERAGAAHWIDHVVVPTNDMGAWVAWAENVIGVERQPIRGLTTRERRRDQPISTFLYMGDGSCHFGAFLQPDELPTSQGVGKEFPRYGFFVRPEDLDTHMLRLEQNGIEYEGPVDTSSEGAEGAAVRFEDPDGNQWEFFAPKEMPAGAMEVSTKLGVGRVSSAAYGSRDLQRTADFCERYFGLQRMAGPQVPEDTLVLPLEAGGRLIYHLTNKVDERVTGHGPWFAMHSAFTVPDEVYMDNYRLLWEGVPEEQDTKEHLGLPVEQEDALPARTGLHGSPAGRKWKEMHSRGDEIYDWDGHAFHFIGGISKQGDSSLATYRPKEQEAYLEELAEAVSGMR